METVAVNRYPLDYDVLAKGDIIPVERLERIVNAKYGSNEYNIRVLNLKTEIERELKDRGMIVSVCSRAGSLHILIDKDATVYNQQRFRAAIKGMMAAHTRTLGVDRTQLNDDERKDHDQRIVNQSRIVQAVNRERKAIAVQMHQRTIPA